MENVIGLSLKQWGSPFSFFFFQLEKRSDRVKMNVLCMLGYNFCFQLSFVEVPNQKKRKSSTIFHFCRSALTRSSISVVLSLRQYQGFCPSKSLGSMEKNGLILEKINMSLSEIRSVRNIGNTFQSICESLCS